MKFIIFEVAKFAESLIVKVSAIPIQHRVLEWAFPNVMLVDVLAIAMCLVLFISVVEYYIFQFTSVIYFVLFVRPFVNFELIFTYCDQLLVWILAISWLESTVRVPKRQEAFVFQVGVYTVQFLKTAWFAARFLIFRIFRFRTIFGGKRRLIIFTLWAFSWLWVGFDGAGVVWDTPKLQFFEKLVFGKTCIEFRDLQAVSEVIYHISKMLAIAVHINGLFGLLIFIDFEPVMKHRPRHFAQRRQLNLHHRPTHVQFQKWVLIHGFLHLWLWLVVPIIFRDCVIDLY